jgi:hypothetical protein
MKTKIAALASFTALMALLVAGCTPPATVKSIAGVSIPTLDTNKLTGVWMNGGKDKGVIATRIKEGTNGLVEVASLNASPAEISLQRFPVVLRDSPAGLIWNLDPKALVDESGKPTGKDSEKESAGYLFGRVIVESDHLLIYLPDNDSIKSLAKRGLLKVSFEKDDKGEDKGSPIIEALGKTEFDNLQTNGVNPYVLFQTDPGFVFVRISKTE